MEKLEESLVSAENVFFSHARKKVLESISFEISRGQFVIVSGENGAGKTTLLNLLMGFRSTDSGKLSIFGEDPFKDAWQSRSRIDYLSEKIDFPAGWTLQDTIEYNRGFYRNYSIESERELIKLFSLDTGRTFASCSTGEVRKSIITIGLSHDPDLIIDFETDDLATGGYQWVQYQLR